MELKENIQAVDLFCGAAGLSLGLKRSGINIVAGIDLDPACQYPFEQNIGSPFLQLDVQSLTDSKVADLFSSEIRVLAGCAPCQPFSGYTTRRRAIDKRWQLLLEFLRIAEGVKPEIVTLENVPRLAHLPLWTMFVSRLEMAGYHVTWAVLDAAQYGVPQNRRRLVLLGSRLGKIDLPKPNKTSRTVRSAIGNLSRIPAGKKNEADPLHAARALTARNLARIRIARPAGTWKEWPKNMRAACHTTESGRTFLFIHRFMVGCLGTNQLQPLPLSFTGSATGGSVIQSKTERSRCVRDHCCNPFQNRSSLPPKALASIFAR
ncbi:DNA (cytosine-5)-methyltransferase 1 [Bradyrhizobium elkanii]